MSIGQNFPAEKDKRLLEYPDVEIESSRTVQGIRITDSHGEPVGPEV
jgi:hypothetical protein